MKKINGGLNWCNVKITDFVANDCQCQLSSLDRISFGTTKESNQVLQTPQKPAQESISCRYFERSKNTRENSGTNVQTEENINSTRVLLFSCRLQTLGKLQNLRESRFPMDFIFPCFRLCHLSALRRCVHTSTVSNINVEHTFSTPILMAPKLSNFLDSIQNVFRRPKTHIF
jgi:hypothetical protein